MILNLYSKRIQRSGSAFWDESLCHPLLQQLWHRASVLEITSSSFTPWASYLSWQYVWRISLITKDSVLFKPVFKPRTLVAFLSLSLETKSLHAAERPPCNTACTWQGVDSLKAAGLLFSPYCVLCPFLGVPCCTSLGSATYQVRKLHETPDTSCHTRNSPGSCSRA